MSEEERAIAPDPAKGIVSGVILVEEIEQIETAMKRPYYTTIHERTYHRRAKILSDDGRRLAALGFQVWGLWKVERLWFHSILPDGTVHELSPSDIEKLRHAKGEDLKTLDVTWPVVVPGCIIDYRHVVTWNGLNAHGKFPIQSAWPIRSFRLRWTPRVTEKRKFWLEQAEGLNIRASQEKGTILVEGSDLPAAPAPLDERGAALSY